MSDTPEHSVRLRPQLFASREFQALERGLVNGVAILAVEMIFKENCGIELGAQHL